MKLLFKVSLAITLVSLIAGVSVVIVSYTSMKEIFQRDVSESQIEIAHGTMDKIDRLLYERHKDIKAMIQHANFGVITTALTTEDTERFCSLLSTLTVATGPWDRLYLVNREGIIVASSKRQQIGKPIR